MVELTMYQYTYETTIGFALLVAGIPVYLIVRSQRNMKNSSCLNRFMSKDLEIKFSYF